MTIPTLIANTNSAKFRSQFKKSISTLNQAGLMAQAQYDIDYAATTTACSATKANAAAENPDTNLTFCGILNGTLSGFTYVGDPSALPGKASGSNYTWVSAPSLGAMNTYLAYQLADGSLIGFKKDAKACQLAVGTALTSTVINSSTGLKDCLGFIDVNGVTLPNKEVNCTTGNTAALTPDVPCVVGSDANHMTDIYPIVFHDATVEPATNAAKYVLTTSK